MTKRCRYYNRKVTANETMCLIVGRKPDTCELAVLAPDGNIVIFELPKNVYDEVASGTEVPLVKNHD